MDKTQQVTERDTSGVNYTQCFYCLGDRPDVHGVLPDLVVLHIAEQATSFEEALHEFEEFERQSGERMRLNVIVRCDSAMYFESIK